MTEINRNFVTEPMTPFSYADSYAEGLEHRLRDRLRIQRLCAAPKTIGNRLALGLALPPRPGSWSSFDGVKPDEPFDADHCTRQTRAR
jgi:hypothetical protein